MKLPNRQTIDSLFTRPKIYTSYFAAISKLPKGCALISIARKNPVGITFYAMPQLAPSYDILREYKSCGGTKARYAQRYISEVLNCLDPEDTYNYICSIVRASGKNCAVLLCYEKPYNFCHRHIVADWLTKSGHPVKEWGSDR